MFGYFEVILGSILGLFWVYCWAILRLFSVILRVVWGNLGIILKAKALIMLASSGA